MTEFRIYGDNIIECERIAAIILQKLNVIEFSVMLASPSVIKYKIKIINNEDIILELIPGFNKANRLRWEIDIFDVLKKSGSILDETPDVLVTKINGNMETILFAIEFCSALQAGNQAWQRSGRAFSIGRTGCPYIYVVDFVKYELNSETRERKALRFPNYLVPYSYIIFSKKTGNFVAQVYVQSEEFEPVGRLEKFPYDAFAFQDLAHYMIARMFGKDTSVIQKSILNKNMTIVNFLNDSSDIAIVNKDIHFRKNIASKSKFGMTSEVQALAERYGTGVAKGFPFGVVPASEREAFAKDLASIYAEFDMETMKRIGSDNCDLLFCMIKGSKPRGDDNRPDRGILPLAMMLFPTGIEILTFIYGPILQNNLNLLKNDKTKLAMQNGFWNVILALSDFVVLDTPVLPVGKIRLLLNNYAYKQDKLNISNRCSNHLFPTFKSVPLCYHEDDVDTAIHFIFAHMLKDCCFEGLCNPPGGDWSGLSIHDNGIVRRWLSLPRVSGKGKRPDHVLELFGIFDKPLLLIIESKEHSANLEPYVGPRLLNYVWNLMRFIPNAEYADGNWHKCATYVNSNNFVMLSAAAYLNFTAQPEQDIFRRTRCDILFVMEPFGTGWKLEIIANPYSFTAITFKEWFTGRLRTKNSGIVIP